MLGPYDEICAGPLSRHLVHTLTLYGAVVISSGHRFKYSFSAFSSVSLIQSPLRRTTDIPLKRLICPANGKKSLTEKHIKEETL